MKKINNDAPKIDFFMTYQEYNLGGRSVYGYTIKILDRICKLVDKLNNN